ncbi:MAG: carbohydrate kinase [Bacteroidaceae bacterium]|nr:carbohydrate kinase [Bacteroidaceae bacterium]
MNKTTKVVVGLGEVLWDCLPSGKQLGGAPANFAYHVSQFGHQTCMVSAVGNDKLGDKALQIFDEKKLCYFIPRVDYQTGTVQVSLSGDGIPQYEIKENVAWDNIPFTSELQELAHHTIAVSFGSLAQRSLVSRSTIAKFLEAMPENEDTLKIFDINLRQKFYTKEIIEESLKYCNVLKINDEELIVVNRLFAFQGIDLENCCMALIRNYKLKMVILTCGTNGSYVFTPDLMSFQETPKVKVADTVGAGDSFSAAFCAAILSGSCVSDAHKLAVDASAFVCTQKGAMPVLPKEILNRKK